jgi:SOS response regulatory protein OraA/RecX
MLILTNIKTSRIKNRVNLTFSDDSYLPLLVDDVIKLSLHRNQEITEEKLSQIIQSSLFYLGHEYALRQIAISPKTKKIISQKLKLFFFKLSHKFKFFSHLNFDSVTAQIIDDLESKKLLNQSDFIKSFLTKNQHKSTNQIRFLLAQKGIDTSNLNLTKSNDVESIKRILAKKRITSENLRDFKAKNNLYASLFRQGFEISDIKAAIDDFVSLQ